MPRQGKGSGNEREQQTGDSAEIALPRLGSWKTIHETRKGSRDNSETLIMSKKMGTPLTKTRNLGKRASVEKKKKVNGWVLNISFEAAAKHLGKYV